ncbi:uncharacterized protein LOC116413126 [Galleria mellonella]|uniref:Uncharacterized protein LOC116413126 n=1 Tax=Galleria mellonella TaxID=7137 RepID=A0ABM3MPY1_GALME|nr:uncharacterized protein LOC116413126 [Galleria mellonella]
MLGYQIYIFCVLLCIVKCDKIVCDNQILTDFNNNVIHKEEYCAKAPCIITPCDTGEVIVETLDHKFICKSVNENLPDIIKTELWRLQTVYKFVYKLDKTDMSFDDFRLIQFKDPTMYSDDCGGNWMEIGNLTTSYFLKDGALLLDNRVKGDPFHVRVLKEYIVMFVLKETEGGFTGPHLYIKVLRQDDQTITRINSVLFIGVGMVISSVFLVLTLIIYRMANKKQGLEIWQYNAFLASLTVAVLTRASISLGIWTGTIGCTSCLLLSPLHNAASLSCHMWLNTMIYDICAIYKSLGGRVMAYPMGMMYSVICCTLYACVVPSLVVSVELVLDCVHLNYFSKPMFLDCAVTPKSKLLYQLLPNSMALGISLILTIFTVKYKRKAEAALSFLHLHEVKLYKKNKKRMIVCCSIMMVLLGNSLCEIIVNGIARISSWLEIVLNTYIAYMGLIITIIFITTNKTMLTYCMKFCTSCRNSSWRTTNSVSSINSLKKCEEIDIGIPQENRNRYSKNISFYFETIVARDDTTHPATDLRNQI